MAWQEHDIRQKLNGEPVALINARAPACLTDFKAAHNLTPIHMVVAQGRVKILSDRPLSNLPPTIIDLDDGLLLPAPVDIHTHLDKGHIWPRRANPDGTFQGALENVGADRQANWSAADVRARMEFSLQCAHHHGTRSIRTHLDSIGDQIDISWEVFDDLRTEWANRINLQAASLFGIDALEDPAFLPRVVAKVVEKRGILGAVAYKVPKLEVYLDQLFTEAAKHGLDLDFHADENMDPTSDCLLKIAEAKLRHGFEGRVLVGHCCSLSAQADDVVKKTIDTVAKAGLGIVSLPLCNMYLQDRIYQNGHAQTPKARGVTLFHELKAAGVPVMAASDNTRDPFYAFGDMDMLEVHRAATRIAHLDHPHDDWISTITKTPASFAGFGSGTLKAGDPADLLLVSARSENELLSRPQSNRIVMRDGIALTTELPDHRVLDAITDKPNLGHDVNSNNYQAAS